MVVGEAQASDVLR